MNSVARLLNFIAVWYDWEEEDNEDEYDEEEEAKI